MLRYTTRMTGLAGAPYFSTQYFVGTEQPEADALTEMLFDFWTAVSLFITNGLSIQIEPEVEVVNTVNGLIEDVLQASAVPVVSGGNAPLPKSTQGLIRLRTTDFVAGRRVQGRVFIPALSNDAQLGGIPSAAFLTAMTTAATALMDDSTTAAVPWSVWARPFDGSEGNPARDGSIHPITSVSTWTQFAVLRSRRD